MANHNFLRFIRCWAGGQVYALDMGWVRSIQRVDGLQRQAGAAGQIGSLELGEVEVPIWSLAERLGGTAVTPSATQRVIVLNDPQHTWGLLIDRVSQVLTVTSDSIYLLPSIALNPAKAYFDRVIRQEDELLLLLSIECLHPDALPVTVPAIDHSFQSASSSPQRRSTSTANQRQGRIVVFKLPGAITGDEDFSWALSVTQIPEILEPLPLLPVPGMPDFLLGLANWRNQPVAVIDLAVRLGLPTQRQGNGRFRLMIVRALGNDELLGFWVDPNIKVLRLPFAHQPCPPPTLLDPQTVRASVRLPSQEIINIPNMEMVPIWGMDTKTSK